MKVNTIHSYRLNNDGTFSENKVTNPEDKADELKTKFGELAIDVVDEVISAMEHEDNGMYYEIKFWTEVKEILNIW
jgi:hypothetical protein